MKTPLLGNVALGTRCRLADGRIVEVRGPTRGYSAGRFYAVRWVCEYLGEYEWLPGRWGARLGPLEVLKGDQIVEKV